MVTAKMMIDEVVRGVDPRQVILEDYWTQTVKTKWHPPPELFSTGTASEIADVLASASDSLKQAMSRLNFYLNRGGRTISDARRKVINAAKDLIRKKFGQ